MDEESEPDVLQVYKPTSLLLRHSNNRMIDKITAAFDGNQNTTGENSSSETRRNDSVHAKTEIIMVDETKNTKENAKPAGIDRETCLIFGQIIDNEDETWELLSDAASWEASFPKEFLSESDSVGTSLMSESETEEMPPGWKKVSDSAGSYYWNTETGKTQTNPPTYTTDSTKSTTIGSDLHTTLNAVETDSHHWSENSREGHMFLVRSLGWLPMEVESLKPEVSSAAVNSCIRLLSNNRSQIMDGVGVWGEGKDLMLLLNDDQLKIVDPLENTILQAQSIKHIRLWGVGRDSSYDFAYVVRDPSTKVYKCHVFRCDAPAQSIAKQLHTICSFLMNQKKKAKQTTAENNGTDIIPVASTEQCQTFRAQYIGSTKVPNSTGITILKQAINKLTRDSNSNHKNVIVSISASALTMSDENNVHLVNCRMRYLSFMGVGDDIHLFGFICVIAGEATCHVVRCTPNAAKLALAVQEACMLRYQKAIDSKQPVKPTQEPTQNSKSLKTKVIKLFSGLRRSGS